MSRADTFYRWIIGCWEVKSLLVMVSDKAHFIHFCENVCQIPQSLIIYLSNKKGVLWKDHLKTHTMAQAFFLFLKCSGYALRILPISSQTINKSTLNDWDSTKLIIFTVLSRTLSATDYFLQWVHESKEHNGYQYSLMPLSWFVLRHQQFYYQCFCTFSANEVKKGK